MGAGGVGKWKSVMQLMRDGAVGKQRPHMLDGVCHDSGLVGVAACPKRRRRDRAAFGQQLANVELALDPALHPNDDHVPVRRQRGHILIQIFRPNDVENPVAPVLEYVGEVFLPIIDEDVRA